MAVEILLPTDPADLNYLVTQSFPPEHNGILADQLLNRFGSLGVQYKITKLQNQSLSMSGENKP